MAAAPGVLAGALLTGLVFFLNPELPFHPLPLVRGFCLYGGTLAALSLILLGAGSPSDERMARRLPWAVTLVLILGAGLYFVHASRYSYFLLPGINTRLVKAAVGLTLAGLACFYTALLHTLHRRPYKRRSRAGFVLFSLGALFVMLERREAFQPTPTSQPRPTSVSPRSRPFLRVVGLEGATLDAILPLAEQGELPFLSRLVQEGAYGRLESIPPGTPVALWTSLATGKLPFRHRYLGARVYRTPLAREIPLRLLPAGIAFRLWGTADRVGIPADATLRRALAFWEIAARLGAPAGAVDWPAATPSLHPVRFAFSDRYFYGDFAAAEARPAELAERGVLFKVEASELDPEMLEGLGRPLPYALLEALAGDLWRESLARFLVEQQEELEVLFLRLPGLSRVASRYFGGYVAVQFRGAKAPAQLEAARRVTAYYRHLDGVLASLWERTPEPKVLAVVSARGYSAPQGVGGLLATLSGRATRGVVRNAPDGVLLLLGEGIQPGKTLVGAELVDVMPSLLYALGAPIARDLDGRVLTEAFTSRHLASAGLTFVPSYQNLSTSGLP